MIISIKSSQFLVLIVFLISLASAQLNFEPSSKCSLIRGLHANLIRFITQEGFHRELEESLEITVTNSRIPLHYFENGQCLVALCSTLSRDVFVDPYEISRSKILSQSVRVLSNWTDLESPSWLSTTLSTVFIQLSPIVTGNLISAPPVHLPLHYRYQKPFSHSLMRRRRGLKNSDSLKIQNPSGYLPITLPYPQVLIRCTHWDLDTINEECKTEEIICNVNSSRDSTCNWIHLPYKSNSKSGTIYIPIGDLDSLLLVTSLTLIIVFGGLIFLMIALVRAKERILKTSPSQSQHSHAD